MKNLAFRIVFAIFLIAVLLTGCARPQVTVVSPSATLAQAGNTQIIPSATPIPPTSTKVAVPPSSTKAVVPPTELPKSPTSIPASNIKIVLHPGINPDQNELWLEFTFPSSEVLSGNTLSESLEKGTLQIVLPDGTVQTFEKVPPVPKDAASAQGAVGLPEGVGINNLNGTPGDYFLSEYTFENYKDIPAGPEIRIPLEQVMNGFKAGEYQISWSSVGSLSETVILQWDGKTAKSIKP